jgi:hypothetical protein
MKTLKIGIVLLAFMLAAMVMVPMVSAIEQSTVTASPDQTNAPTIDVSKIQLPQLIYDKNQTPIVMNDEMSLDQNTQSTQIARMVEGSSNPAISKIPFGAIIHHSTDGITTVFDSTGKQLFTADDSKAGLVSTFKGRVPATHVQEVPDKSVIYDMGNVLYVFSNKTLILTVTDDNISGKNSALTASSSSTISPQWIEWGSTNAIPTAVGQFIAQWNVPTKPTLTKNFVNGNPPSYFDSSLEIWNGLENDPSLLQPVLEWYIKDAAQIPSPSTPMWTMATWYVWGSGNSFIHSTRTSGIYSGDQMQGNIQLNTLGYDGIASITDLGNQGGGSSTLFLAKSSAPIRMPTTNLQAEVVLEGWDPTSPLGGLNSQYLCGPITFQNFVLKDSNGNNLISNYPMSGYYNTNYWNPSTYGLSISNLWPTSITLGT